MAHACSCLKKNRQPCSIEADRERNGRWYCHIHDPRGNFQTNSPSHPEPINDDADSVSVKTLIRALENLTLRIEALEHDAAKRHADAEYRRMTTSPDDCPFIANT